MIILLDMDEVLTDLITGVNAFYNEHHGTNFTRNDYRTCIWQEVWGCTYEYADRICHEFITSTRGQELRPISGSVKGIQRLRRDHQLVVATSRKFEYEELTRAWLSKVYGIISFKEIYLLNQYGEGKTIKKSTIGRQIGANLAIDDQVRHAIDLASVGIPCLVLDSPWNTDEELPSLARRVLSWEDILKEIYDKK